MKLPSPPKSQTLATRAPVAPSMKLTRDDHPAVEWPNLRARRCAVFGNRVIEPGGAQLVSERRGQL